MFDVCKTNDVSGANSVTHTTSLSFISRPQLGQQLSVWLAESVVISLKQSVSLIPSCFSSLLVTRSHRASDHTTAKIPPIAFLALTSECHLSPQTIILPP